MTHEMFDGVSVTIQVTEHYDDGTSKCVDRGSWSDD